MRRIMKLPKIDMSLVVELLGIGLAGYGLYLVAPALSFIALGTFLIWTVERN